MRKQLNCGMYFQVLYTKMPDRSLQSLIRKCDSNFHSRNECGFLVLSDFYSSETTIKQAQMQKLTSRSLKTGLKCILKTCKTLRIMQSQGTEKRPFLLSSSSSSSFFFFPLTYQKFESSKILESHTK